MFCGIAWIPFSASFTNSNTCSWYYALVDVRAFPPTFPRACLELIICKSMVRHAMYSGMNASSLWVALVYGLRSTSLDNANGVLVIAVGESCTIIAVVGGAWPNDGGMMFLFRAARLRISEYVSVAQESVDRGHVFGEHGSLVERNSQEDISAFARRVKASAPCSTSSYCSRRHSHSFYVHQEVSARLVHFG